MASKNNNNEKPNLKELYLTQKVKTSIAITIIIKLKRPLIE